MEVSAPSVQKESLLSTRYHTENETLLPPFKRKGKDLKINKIEQNLISASSSLINSGAIYIRVPKSVESVYDAFNKERDFP
jgi:hypothetical protein